MTADAAIAAAAPARVATWALVVLLVAFVLLETLIDVLLGRLGSWFEKKRRAGLLRALEGQARAKRTDNVWCGGGGASLLRIAQEDMQVSVPWL